MPDYRLVSEINPAQEEVAIIKAGLSAFNRQALGNDAEDNYQALNLFVRAEDDTIMGGLLGGSWWGWVYISVLWVHDDLRGQHFGTQLMEMAEDEGLKRGCHSIFVDTHSFQALPFYLKLGYTLFGELENFPVGHTRYYLQKRLQPTKEA